MVGTRQENSTVLYTSPCQQLLEEQREAVAHAEGEVLGKGVSSGARPQCVNTGLQPPVLWGTSCCARPATSTSLLLRQCRSAGSSSSSPCPSSDTAAASCPPPAAPSSGPLGASPSGAATRARSHLQTAASFQHGAGLGEQQHQPQHRQHPEHPLLHQQRGLTPPSPPGPQLSDLGTHPSPIKLGFCPKSQAEPGGGLRYSFSERFGPPRAAHAGGGGHPATPLGSPAAGCTGGAERVPTPKASPRAPPQMGGWGVGKSGCPQDTTQHLG